MSLEQMARDLSEARKGHIAWIQANQNESGVLKSDSTQEFRNREKAINDQASAYEAARDAAKSLSDNQTGVADLNAPLERKIRGGEINPGDGPGRPDAKSIGTMFVESNEFKNSHGGNGGVRRLTDHESGPAMMFDVDKTYGKGRGFKTLFDTASSWSIQNIRLPEPVTPGAQQPTIASLMPEGRTSGNAILYMEETTTTTGAAETDESGTKPEAALAFTQRTANVRKIAVSLPVTDEALDDIPFIESYIDTRLSFFVRQREDSELLVGDATGVNLRGLINTSGIETQATGTDSNQDAILKAIVQVQTNAYFDADAVVLHPANWQTMRLAKDDVGNYLFGPPNLPGADQVWGYRIVKTTAMTSGTGLVGAFAACAEVFRRSDLAMQVGWINDQFVKNQRTILLEERLALVVFRPKGFCKITSLA